MRRRRGYCPRSPVTEQIEQKLVERFGVMDFAWAMGRVRFKADLVQVLIRRRVAMDLDQRDLARMLRTSQQQLSRYETGENGLTLDRLYEMCLHLGLELVVMDSGTGKVLASTEPEHALQAGYEFTTPIFEQPDDRIPW